MGAYSGIQIFHATVLLTTWSVSIQNSNKIDTNYWAVFGYYFAPGYCWGQQHWWKQIKDSLFFVWWFWTLNICWILPNKNLFTFFPFKYLNILQLLLWSRQYLPDPRGAGLHEAFQFSSVRPSVRTSVRTSVSNSFSLLLLGQYTSDPQYFYRFRTPYKMTIRGAD